MTKIAQITIASVLILARASTLSLSRFGNDRASQGQLEGRPQPPYKPLQLRLGYPAEAKLLILNADDLAIAHSEDMASFTALEQKWITSGTVMVPCPWLTEVAAYAKAHPAAGLGSAPYLDFGMGYLPLRTGCSSRSCFQPHWAGWLFLRRYGECCSAREAQRSRD